MVIKNLDELSNYLLKAASDFHFKLRGPLETQYGFGWDPTVTFWFEDRRVHFYFELFTADELKSRIANGVTVEVAEVKNSHKIFRAITGTRSKVKRALIKGYDEAWIIIDRFLRQGCDFECLPDYGWIIDKLDSDKFIPHPPDGPNAANIAALTDSFQQQEIPITVPEEKNSKALLQCVINRFKKNNTK